MYEEAIKLAKKHEQQAGLRNDTPKRSFVRRLVSSLALKIGAAIIVTEILVLSAIGIPLIQQRNDDIDQRAVERILIPSTLLQEGVLSYASLADRRIMTDLLGEELIAGMVIGSNGNVFHSLDPENLGKNVGAVAGLDSAWFEPSVAKRQMIKTRRKGETYLVSVTPIFTFDRKTPSLFAYIKTNTTKLTKEKAEWRNLIIQGMFAVVLVTSLIIFFSFQMLVFRRILRSVGFIEQVRDGNVEDYLANPGNDEFGILERGINQMVAKIQQRSEQRDQAEQNLRQSELRYRGLFENSDVAIWNEDLSEVYKTLTRLRLDGVVDLRRHLKDNPKIVLDFIAMVKVLHVNEATLKLFDAKAEIELLTQIEKTFGPGGIEVFIEELCAIWEGKAEFRSEAGFLTLAGKELVTIITFQIPKTEEGFQSIAVTIIDITERKNAEKALRDAHNELELRVHERTTQLRGEVEERRRIEAHLIKANQEAETANRAKSEFLANMSHELRTPLNAIIGFSETLSEKIFGPLGNEKQEEYIDYIHQSGEHLLSLINDILDVSAIEADKMELNEADVDMEDVVAASVLMIKPRAEQGGIELINTVNGQRLIIRADERRMKQVLVNLLSNAVKFTNEGGTVTVGTDADEDGSITISVADTGIGMSAEDIIQAMEPFGQVLHGELKDHEGTGLGLPLTKRLVEAQGGSLIIESEPNIGTTVKVKFPKDRDARSK